MLKRNLIVIGIFIILLSLIISLSGIVHMKKPDLKQIENSIVSSTNVNQYTKATFLELKKNYGVYERDIDGFVYYAPKSSMDASEILVIKFKDPKQVEKVISVVNNRTTKRREMYKSYRPQEADILDSSYVEERGNYLIFVASKDVNKIKESISNTFN